jgi:hypothetical protein
MDILSGLTLAGNTIYKNITNNNKSPAPKKARRTQPMVNNIYDSNQYRKSSKEIQQRARYRNKLSTDPKTTGMIPKFYNKQKFIDNIKDKNLKFLEDQFQEENLRNLSTNNKKEIKKYGIKGYPSIFLEIGDKKIEYNGSRNIKAIKEFVSIN